MTPPELTAEVRALTPVDERGVDVLLRGCFPSRAEARLVQALRFSARPLVELVAEARDAGDGADGGGGGAGGGAGRGSVVGHVMLSPATVVPESDDPWFVWALAPLAVAEGWRGRGIGRDLVRRGVSAALERRRAPVFVLGDPGYYRKLGFRPAVPLGFQNPFVPPGEDSAFQVLVGDAVGLGKDFAAGAPDPKEFPEAGWLRYHEAFDALDASGGSEA